MLEKKNNAYRSKKGDSVDFSIGKRIMIVGCAGSGKTTLALKIGEAMDIPVYHLDKYYWRDWKETPDEEWKKTVTELAAQPTWIIDGNYRATISIRLERADTVIFLDYGTLTCLWGVLKRAFRHRGTIRPDMGEGCMERIDWSFIKWVLGFRRKARKPLVEVMDAYRGRVNIITFTNRKKAEKFLMNLI